MSYPVTAMCICVNERDSQSDRQTDWECFSFFATSLQSAYFESKSWKQSSTIELLLSATEINERERQRKETKKKTNSTVFLTDC